MGCPPKWHANAGEAHRGSRFCHWAARRSLLRQGPRRSSGILCQFMGFGVGLAAFSGTHRFAKPCGVRNLADGLPADARCTMGFASMLQWLEVYSWSSRRKAMHTFTKHVGVRRGARVPSEEVGILDVLRSFTAPRKAQGALHLVVCPGITPRAKLYSAQEGPGAPARRILRRK